MPTGLIRVHIALLFVAWSSPGLAQVTQGATAQVANAPADAAADPVAPAVEPSAQPETEFSAALRQAFLEQAKSNRAADAADRAALSAIYSGRGGQPIWVDDARLTDRASATLAELAKAADWGLDPNAFERPEAAPSDGQMSKIALAEAEAKLSLAVLTYARHAKGGRISEPSKDLSSYLDRKPVLLDPAVVLTEIAKADDPAAYLRGLHPKHPQFEKLRQAYLALLKPDSSAPEAIRLPAGGPMLKPGDTHADVALLRQRLKVAPEPAGGQPSDPASYDEALVRAVKAFQKDAGLSADGFVGSGTRAALNGTGDTVSPEKLLANMEQWRWMPDDLGEVHVAANIPEFTIRVVKSGQVIHSERMITGLIGKQTPVFSDEIEQVVIHPFWGVPDSIKVKELYPSLARGGSYFTRSGLRLQHNGREVDPQSVDWSTADIRNYHVYQPPGGGNVLGVVKFLFPNKHQTYMHDTPTKNLFNSTQRTFSHGCMRIRNPVRLVEILLEADKGWDASHVAGLVSDGAQNNAIDLDRHVPVHMTYFTAWVTDDGSVETARDVYGHEKRIALALAGKPNLIARHPDHLAPVPRAKIPQYARRNEDGNANDVLMRSIFGGF